MTEHLGSRVVGTSPTADVETCLADLRPGTTAVIDRLCEEADAATARRYFDLGFVPGAHVHVVRRAPLRGPVVVRVAGYEIALRRNQARCIKVDSAQALAPR
ncbi:FeoA family protein [uncultured Williamsia sp.]|uniref:FeoA family protein n=1 Tax=uncultured Williamsia sp. TaxID=259311 RepID=UPI002603F299|nr:FeoA family protein [uncultured Williamsia sp.]